MENWDVINNIHNKELFSHTHTHTHTSIHIHTPLYQNTHRQYYYYYLTVEGIDYLRQYLNLPQDVVPQTHTKKESRPARPAGFGGDRGDRQFEKEKRVGPDGSFQPSFGGGGFGRGNRERGEREYRG